MRLAINNAGALAPEGNPNLPQTAQCDLPLIASDERLYEELWLSLASLLRSYTALHGLHQGAIAEIENDGQRISARNKNRCLKLERNNKMVTWMRENGSKGVLELTDHGRLKGPGYEEELDMAAEAWARELMTAEAAQ